MGITVTVAIKVNTAILLVGLLTFHGCGINPTELTLFTPGGLTLYLYSHGLVQKSHNCCTENGLVHESEISSVFFVRILN